MDAHGETSLDKVKVYHGIFKQRLTLWRLEVIQTSQTEVLKFYTDLFTGVLFFQYTA